MFEEKKATNIVRYGQGISFQLKSEFNIVLPLEPMKSSHPTFYMLAQMYSFQIIREFLHDMMKKLELCNNDFRSPFREVIRNT